MQNCAAIKSCKAFGLLMQNIQRKEQDTEQCKRGEARKHENTSICRFVSARHLRKVTQETDRGEVGTVWALEGDLTFRVYLLIPIEYSSMCIIIK